MASLKDDFSQRNVWFNNRSSAVFPAFVTEKSDTRIVFLNYWTIKNAISNLHCNLRLFDEGGTLISFLDFPVTEMHNDLSIREIAGSSPFKGSAHIEFISTENLRFPFPAVIALYESNAALSAVHSAGRIKNPNESIARQMQVETNWTCVLDENVEPYFHVFNGNCHRATELVVRVTAYSAEGREPLADAVVSTGVSAAFASRYVHLSECFDAAELAGLRQTRFFLALELEHAETFPRLVVGNFDRSANHYSATHSYTWQTNQTDFVRPEDGGVAAFLPLINVSELSLEAVSFPTNAAARVVARERKGMLGETCRPTDVTIAWDTGGEGASVLRLKLDEPGLAIYDILDAAPARLNVTYRYSVKGAGGGATRATDLATGFKAAFYPPKRTHWGHGVLGDGFRTVVMLRNVSWERGGTAPARGTLRVYTAAGTHETEISIAPDAATAVYLDDFVPAPEGRSTVSWYVQMDEPTVETFWVAFRSDGAICGEHGF